VPGIPRHALCAFEFEATKILDEDVHRYLARAHPGTSEIGGNPEAFKLVRFSPQRAEDKRHAFARLPILNPKDRLPIILKRI